MMILIIDNYDSFTYNLYQAVGPLTPSVQVVRNDSLTVSEAAPGHHPFPWTGKTKRGRHNRSCP